MSCSMLRVFTLLSMLALSACMQPEANVYQLSEAQGQDDAAPTHATIGAIKQTQFLFNRLHTQATINYIAAPPTKVNLPLDILILFDRTASMEDVIKSTADAATHLVQEIHQFVPDTRFAIASVSDYSPLYTNDADKRTWLLMSDFVYDAQAVHAATSEIRLVNGGDKPEAYVRGLYEASQLQWRPQAKKMIVFFGDAEAHTVDPGRDEQLGTADDLNMATVLNDLKSKGIVVVGIYTDNNEKTIQQFMQIAQMTNGQIASLSNADASDTLIKNSIKSAFKLPWTLRPVGQYADWVKSVETDKTIFDGNINYAIGIQLPEGTPAGQYKIQLKLQPIGMHTSRDVKMNENKLFEVNIITGWYNHWFVLWLPLILFLSYLLCSALLMLRGGYSEVRYVLKKSTFELEGYDMNHLLMDILFFASVISVPLAIYLQLTHQVLSQIL